MFTPETMTGIIVIDSPRSLPTLDAVEIPQLPSATESDESMRGMFFSMVPEDRVWCGSPEGQEIKRRLESKGLL